MPTILDKIDDRAANAYAAFPDRIYVLGADGRIAYKGQPGPGGFNVAEAMAALEVAMEGEITPYGEQPGVRQQRARGGGRGARGGAGRGGGQDMGVMDTDEDGRISAAEWDGESDVFERFDADGDGFLTRQEVQRGGRGGRGGANPQDRFRNMDADGDGQVSSEEFPGQPALFDLLDVDRDGFVSESEMGAAGGRGRGRGRGRGGANAPALAEMDSNGDGRVSREEWTGPEQTFDRRDVNEDGFLTQDELGRGRGGRGPGIGGGDR